jgi:PhnB protein
MAKKKVHFIPPGYQAVTPYLACAGAAQAIAFYKKAFGAAELMRMPAPGGKVGHAEVKISDARVMLADEHPDIDFLGPQARGGSPVHLHVYVKNVDATMKRAVGAGAKLLRAVENKFYGDRTGTVQDPFGHVWHLSTHVENLSMAELRKRAKKAMQDAGG